MENHQFFIKTFANRQMFLQKLQKLVITLLCFYVCLSRHMGRTEESSGQPVPVPRGKKRLSGSYLGDSKPQVAGPHQTSKPTTPQKRPADGAASPEVC